jgi:hypothetical protein
MPDKPGVRGLIDDLRRIHFAAIVVPIVMASLWVWWSKTQHMPPPVIALMALATFTLFFVGWYFVALIGHKYLGVPAENPFYPAPRTVPTGTSSVFPQSVTQGPPPQKNAIDKARFVTITPEYIASLYDGLLMMEGEKRAAHLIGAWTQISGVIGDAWDGDHHDGGSLQIVVGARFLAGANFDLEWKERFRAFVKMGRPITVIGQIHAVGTNSISMSHCQIVETPSSLDASSSQVSERGEGPSAPPQKKEGAN